MNRCRGGKRKKKENIDIDILNMHESILKNMEKKREKIPTLKKNLENLNDLLNETNKDLDDDYEEEIIKQIESKKKSTRLNLKIDCEKGEDNEKGDNEKGDNEKGDNEKGKMDKIENKFLEDSSDEEIINKDEIKTQIKSITKEIENLDTCSDQGYYMLKVHNLIENYRQIISLPIQIDFMTGQIKKDHRKEDLINKFLEIIKNYEEFIDLDNFKSSSEKQKKNTIICENCHNEIYFTQEIKDKILCKCGYNNQVLFVDSGFNDTKRVNISQRYFYTVRNNIKSAFNKFQGIQNNKAPPEIEIQIRELIKNYNLKISDITEQKIKILFQEIEYPNKNYDSVPYLYRNITGKSKNWKKYEEKTLLIFDLMKPIYDEVKPKERDSFMQVHYFIFKTLQLLGANPDENDFSLHKDRDKIIEHDETWKRIIEKINIMKENGAKNLHPSIAKINFIFIPTR